jgi:hypothetical protein
VEGNSPAEPFRIAGNFFYVGANDVTSCMAVFGGGEKPAAVLAAGFAP